MKGVDSAYPRMALHSVAILCCLFLQVQDAWSNYIQGTFQNPSNQAAAFFSHLVINKNTGTVYIGGVNAIYQLTPNLLNQTKVLTGPKLDNPNCPPPTQPLKCTDDNHRKPTNSYSKVLIVDYASQRLIACWSLFQGFCEKRHLDDIKKKDVVDTYVPVVANNQNASTFAFIAPGPGNPQSNVMYVGVSRTKTGLEIYRDLVPAFCSRQLVNFELAFKSVVQDSSKKTIETQHRDMFPIKYVYGFGSENFSYMLTVQKAGTQSENYVSKIFRVCQNDKHFFSYAEIPLVCKSGGTSYNLVQAAYVAKVGRLLAQNLVIPITEDVLYAVFAVGNLESAEATARSALCIYPLRNVRKIFTENIRKCFQGLGNIGPEHLTATGVCQKTKFVIHDSYCGAHDINQPIAGEKPIKADATYVFRNNATVSSVAVSITHEYTVAFIGTSNGHIQKVAIDTKNMATMYEDITVSPGSRVNPDSDFDLDKNHLYVLTMHKLSKLRVQDCERYRKCSMCLGAKDPYCGWCTLENKCSLRSDCSEADQDLRWLPYIGQQCSTITSLDPAQVQILKEPSKTQMLKMQIMNLPQVRGTYQCAFGPYNRNLTFTTLANLTTNGAQCETPLYSQLPAISTGQDHIVMKLSVRVDGKDFVSINFTFFDCTVHESCTHCTQSNFPCNWCIRNHICTKDAQKNCKSDHIVSGKKTDSLGISGPHFCPRITYRVNVIPVPAGIRKKISLNAINLKDFQTDIKCIFKMNTWKQVPAITASLEIIECKSVLFSYIDDSAYHNVPFEITWGEHHRKLDNPKNIQVKMYKCDAMAKSCGACLTMDGMYECGWCENKCSIQHQCETQWHPSTYTCPNPNIFEFTPHKGPVQGGTPLTIKGENLGKKFHDISNGIKVAGIRCKPIEKQYRAAEKIVCETGRSDSEKSGKILVVVANDVSVASDDQFHYVNPHADSITPSVGPMDGGTLVTIKGEHLNTGANFFVNISDFPCKLYNVSEKVIMCSTSASSTIVGGSVKMSFDGYLVISASAVYHYVGNPGIEDVEPKKSISSGGLPIQVFGSNFSIIQRPEMILWVSDKPYYGPCTMLSDVRLDCYSPNITEEFLRSNFNAQPLAYGFRMDNVTSLLNLTNLYGLFQVFSDPQFTPFPENVKSHQYTNEYLTINGKNLNSAIREKQVIVRIGKDYCNVTSLAATQLTCQPPKVQPESATNKDYPEVIVQVGRNLSYHIGFLRYEEPEGTSLHMVIGLAVGGGVLLMIVIIVVIAYRVKSQQSTNMKKQLQIQMDQLESKVAKECKEAFAELQTDMTELTSDLSGQVAIPFWDYRTYCMNVLFPGVKDHPVTKVDEFAFQRENPMNPNDKGLKNFLQLMKNKTFLLIFIRSLEANKQFTMRDRVNVASLISVTLQGNMEYATDILKTLVAELIERSVEGTNHPKLLLRRTESVAEKMLTNWFTFLLFRFLKDCAGEPLFLLFQAIKQQVSKGPVDAITSEARYSLSEDKLIRQQIDFRQMSVNVYDLEQFRQPHQAKVLDCDTITQVKEKILDAIYKNAPFSSRPAKDNLHLEWHVGPQQILILQDEDNTSKIEGDFRRLNTLAHYKVPDGAYMALRMKQSTFNTPVQSEKSVTYKYDNSSLNTRSPSLNRTVTSQSGQQEMESGVNKYHLVKQHDSPTHREGDRGSKMVSEIYLTRLLATKGTLQQFVDDLFERIFSTAHRGHVLPLAIKYVFDFLDDQAMHHNIDSEVVHTWKSNSLPLRFWVNIIKNPNFVFNIYKSNIVDSCLSVVAQTFMDSCSMSEHRLGKDSPSSKLLYAKDIPKYKRWVERYYQDIRVMPAISDQDMNAMLSDESRYHEREFNTDCALLELYEYVKHYNKDLVQALDEDEFGKKNRLSAKLEQVHAAMETTATYC